MEKLIIGQQELFEQLKKAECNFKTANQEMRSKYSYLTARMESLDQLEDIFNRNHLEIVLEATTEQKLQLPYFRDDMQDNFQELFLEYKALLKEFIAVTNPTSITTMTSRNENTEMKVDSSEVQLPKIVLPKFSGKYNEWQSLCDIFVSLIHENTTLSPIQKLHYLKSNLTGEPEILLKSFTTTLADYIEAWEQLTKRYNNKRYKYEAIMKILFEQKTIPYGSASAIRLLLDTTTSCLKESNNLNIKTEQWDAVIVNLVASKLDHESHRQWEEDMSVVSDELPKWTQLEKFLETRFRNLEMLDTTQTSTIMENLTQVETETFHSTVAEKVSTTERECAVYDDSSFCYCAEFKNLPMLERETNSTKLTKRKKQTHITHTSRLNEQRTQQSVIQATSSTNEANVIVNFSRGNLKTSCVLLATAIVKTMSSNGSHNLRVLVDQESEASFVSKETVKLLGLKRTNVNGKVSNLGDGQLNIKHSVSLEVELRYEPGKNITVNAYVLKSLTSLLPSRKVHVPDWLELKNLPLADPGFASPGRVDVLLGADVYGEILLRGMKKIPNGNLIAQNTIFGWIVCGKLSNDFNSENITTSKGRQSTEILEDRERA